MPAISYQGKKPTLKKGAHIFEGAQVIGEVRLGEDVGVWFNATLRGDMDKIEVGDRTNIQDNAVLHTDANQPTILGSDVTVGHSAIIHAATIKKGALIGMGSIVLNGAEIGEDALVAAGTLVAPGKIVPRKTLVMGNPMKIVRELKDEEIEQTKKNKDHYVDLLNSYK